MEEIKRNNMLFGYLLGFIAGVIWLLGVQKIRTLFKDK